MSAQLPPRPNLENLKKQAKSLHKAHRSGDSAAAECIKTHLPRLADASPEEILQSDFTLQEAQLVLAREYGFPSWPKLVEAVSRAEESPPLSESLSDRLQDLLTRAFAKSGDSPPPPTSPPDASEVLSTSHPPSPTRPREWWDSPEPNRSASATTTSAPSTCYWESWQTAEEQPSRS